MTLCLQNLSVGYTAQPLSPPINLSIDEGQFIVLYGNNGCGKTTLIKTLSGLHNAISGNLILDTENLFLLSKTTLAKRISVLLTKRPFLMNHTVFDIIALGRIPYLNWKGDINESNKNIILKYAELMNVSDLLQKQAAEISDGQLQKVLIAKTLCQETPIIILDEPLIFLDYSAKKFLLQQLKSFSIKEKKIILISSHDVNMCNLYADSCLLMHQQKWTFISVAELQNNLLYQQFINQT